MIAVRKVRSAYKIISIFLISLLSKIKLKLLEENIDIGLRVLIGRRVIIRTTDNGKVIIGNDVIFEDNAYIYAQNAIISIGDNSFIGSGSQIMAKKSISIGKDALISAYCIIRDANHTFKKKDIPIREQGHIAEPITISDDVWLGAHCVVTSGCEIGEVAVIGANAVVTKEIEKYTINAGVPAKYIRDR